MYVSRETLSVNYSEKYKRVRCFMLDIQYIRSNFEAVLKNLNQRSGDYTEILNRIRDVDAERRALIPAVDELKAQKNELAKQGGELKKIQGLIKKDGEFSLAGEYAKANLQETLEHLESLFQMNVQKSNSINADVKDIDIKLDLLSEEIYQLLLSLPNTLADDVPFGVSEEENVEIRKHGEPTSFNFEPNAHWDLVKSLDIVDFERAAKITGSRFAILKKDGALLERALIQFMLDTHIDNGYLEFNFPLISNKESLTASGQLPKFEEDLFKLTDERGFYLIPTTEVQLVNIHRNEILDGDTLPLNYTGFTTNFRSEAGAAGRDTRGLIRQHQFDKIELFKYCLPENGVEELENITRDAERILQLLKLPYRVIKLCSGDTGANATKTYDIEVWLPSYNAYKEISSCSLTTDFQSRRANIRFKRNKDSKTEYPYLLNGSGLAVGRTFAAIVENYQLEDGTIKIPDVLIPYMRGKKVIK